MDPDAIRRVHGSEPPRRAPVAFRRCLRVGTAAATAAGACNLLVFVLAELTGWSLVPPGYPPVTPLAILLACLVAGLLAAVGGYVAARVTIRPGVWVVTAGLVLTAGSLADGLPPALATMHLVASAWLVPSTWWAVRRGSWVD